MEILRTFLNSLEPHHPPICQQSWQLLQPALREVSLKKGDYLLKEGQVCETLYYVVSGWCKSFFNHEGILKNTGFFFEDQIATDLQSFSTGSASAINMTASVPLKLIGIDKTKLFEATRKAQELETVGRACIRRFATRQEALTLMLQRYDAGGRLSYIETQFPEIIQRVPQTELASFLGVTRETLSRIRKRRTAG